MRRSIAVGRDANTPVTVRSTSTPPSAIAPPPRPFSSSSPCFFPSEAFAASFSSARAFLRAAALRLPAPAAPPSSEEVTFP